MSIVVDRAKWERLGRSLKTTVGSKTLRVTTGVAAATANAVTMHSAKSNDLSPSFFGDMVNSCSSRSFCFRKGPIDDVQSNCPAHTVVIKVSLFYMPPPTIRAKVLISLRK